MAGTTSCVLGLTNVNVFEAHGTANCSTVAAVTGPAGACAGALAWTEIAGASWEAASASAPLSGLVFAPRTGRKRQAVTPTMAIAPSTRISRRFFEGVATGGAVFITPGITGMSACKGSGGGADWGAGCATWFGALTRSTSGLSFTPCDGVLVGIVRR